MSANGEGRPAGRPTASPSTSAAPIIPPVPDDLNGRAAWFDALEVALAQDRARTRWRLLREWNDRARDYGWPPTALEDIDALLGDRCRWICNLVRRAYRLDAQ